MKNSIILALIIICTIACSKENNFKQHAANSSDIVATKDTTKIPLNDLSTRTYYSYVGGLYPNGLNSPSGVYGADLLKTCRNIVPLDTFGNKSENGNIEFISLGWSIGGQNMKVLQQKTKGNPLTNPELSLAAISLGGGDARLNDILNPKDPYWNTVAKKLKQSNSSFRQVQVIYLDTEDSSKVIGFPVRPLLVKDDLESCFRTLQQKFPNVKLVYLVARTTTYGKNHVHDFNAEPNPYHFGWAAKWAIEDQINGVPGTEYKGAHKVSPMVTWGFYEWATETPRTTDGFKWSINLMNSDGLHPNDAGHDTLMTRFQNFLLTDRFAKQWYGK
jgi:hypothetical protein